MGGVDWSRHEVIVIFEHQKIFITLNIIIQWRIAFGTLALNNRNITLAQIPFISYQEDIQEWGSRLEST